MIDNHPEIVNKIKIAIQKATDFSKNNKVELRTIIANNTSLSIEQVSNIVLPYYGSEVDVKSFNKVMELVKEEGWINKMLNSSVIIQ
jgi:ABC-type nitrate/sulfonate/bicarbonate transport system substrate-binding protein